MSLLSVCFQPQTAFPQYPKENLCQRTLTQVNGSPGDNLGQQHLLKGDLRQALQTFQQVLEVCRANHDFLNEVKVLTSLGEVHNNLANYNQALTSLQAAVSLLDTQKHVEKQQELQLRGRILSILGDVYNNLGQTSRALEVLQEALQFHREVADLESKGTTLYYLAGVYESLSQYDQSLKFAEAALSIYRSVKNRMGEGRALQMIGLSYRRLAQYSEALKFYQQAKAINYAVGDRLGLGRTLNGLGSTHYSLGNYTDALEFYDQSLSIRRDVGDRLGETGSLISLGVVHASRGNNEQAFKFYMQALEISRAIGSVPSEGIILINLGSIYYNQGQYAKALEISQQVIRIGKRIGDQALQSLALSNLGATYNNLGQTSDAIDAYRQALAIQGRIGDRANEAATLNELGSVYFKQNQYFRALATYQEALRIRKSIGDQAGMGATLNNIGLIYDRQGEFAQALATYQHALALLQQVGDPRVEGFTLNSIGLAYANLEQPRQALEAFQQALGLFRRGGDLAGERIILSNIGTLLQKQNQPELAIVFYKESVNVTETIRKNLQKLSIEQQKTYTESVAGTYRALADLLLSQGRVLEAQQVLDLLKVQELEDALRNVRSTKQRIEFLKAEQAILDRYASLQKTAIQAGSRIAELAKLDSKNALTPPQQKELADLKTVERQINAQFTAFLTSAEIKPLLKQLANSTGDQSLPLKQFNQIKSKLSRLDALLIYPLILGDRLELVMLAPGMPPLHRTVKNLSRDEINRTILEFRTALVNRRDNVKVPAEQLYRWLIAPLEADLNQIKPKTILYAPDGQLRYIPLAALYDGKQWLVQRYGINNITALAVSDLTTPPKPDRTLLAAAFGDQPQTIRIDNQPFSFSGLPFATKEVQLIASDVPGTVSLFDRAFSRDTLLTRMNSFTIVHLATHGKFLIGKPQNSFLAMGDGTPLVLSEIQDNALDNIDLVVLSACETGVGLTGKDEDGVEVLGLGYQFQRAGAKAAIASLWQVDDGGTQLLMNALYTALKQGMTKAQALQEAQKALITGDYTTVGGKRADIEVIDTRTGPSRTVSSDTLQHPYYWAPFILIGNGL